MQNEQMENAIQSFLSAYADMMLPKLQKVQKILKRLPESMQSLEIKLNALESCEFDTPNSDIYQYAPAWLILSDEDESLVPDDCALSILAQNLGLDVDEDLLSSINYDLEEELCFEDSESAPGEGSSIRITKDLIQMELFMSTLGKVYYKSILVN